MPSTTSSSVSLVSDTVFWLLLVPSTGYVFFTRQEDSWQANSNTAGHGKKEKEKLDEKDRKDKDVKEKDNSGKKLKQKKNLTVDTRSLGLADDEMDLGVDGSQEVLVKDVTVTGVLLDVVLGLLLLLGGVGLGSLLLGLLFFGLRDLVGFLLLSLGLDPPEFQPGIVLPSQLELSLTLRYLLPMRLPPLLNSPVRTQS